MIGWGTKTLVQKSIFAAKAHKLIDAIEPKVLMEYDPLFHIMGYQSNYVTERNTRYIVLFNSHCHWSKPRVS
jgi:hypothetical protein